MTEQAVVNAITDSDSVATVQFGSKTPNGERGRRHAKEKSRDAASKTFRLNTKLAKKIWGELPRASLHALRELSRRFALSISSGDIQLLDGRWYVTHSGLLDIARRRRCSAIVTAIDRLSSNSATNKWVFKASVFKPNSKRPFVSYGDADPSNISPLVRGAEMRIAETRAVNRALRKAYGIGLCSVEELGWSTRPAEPVSPSRIQPPNTNGNGHHPVTQTRLRDQLCLLIRKYDLDPNRVKAYAAHFCGTETIKEASRDLVESFISHLAASAKEDRDGLICKLNSFPTSTEVQQ